MGLKFLVNSPLNSCKAFKCYNFEIIQNVSTKIKKKVPVYLGTFHKEPTKLSSFDPFYLETCLNLVKLSKVLSGS